MNEKLLYCVNNTKISVPIVRTQNKWTYLKIRNNEIIVLANEYIPKYHIEKFVGQNIDKLYKQLQRHNSINLISTQESYFYLFGKKIKFSVLNGFKKTEVKINNGKFYINTHNGTNEEIQKCISLYLNLELDKYIKEKIKLWGNKMNIQHLEYSLRNKKSNWAVNYTKKRKIIFSTRLAHFSHNTIDYVIVHELAHYQEPNHSLNFWKIVHSYIKEYKKLRKNLNDMVLP